MSNTLKRRKSLRSKLLKLCNGDYWTIYEVEGAIFTSEIDAWRRGRKLARVTGEQVTIWKMKVPKSLPAKYSQAVLGGDNPIRSQSPIQVFIVNGKVFTEISDAEQAAKKHAIVTKDFCGVWAGIVDMGDIELIGGSNPNRSSLLAERRSISAGSDTLEPEPAAA